MALVNLVAMIGSCGCCDCNPPTMMRRTASASLSKCGWDEYGMPSSPPRIYLTRTLAGTLTSTSWNEEGCGGDCAELVTFEFSGTCVFSAPDCDRTDTGNNQEKVYQPCETLVSNDAFPVCRINEDPTSPCFDPTVTSPTVLTYNGNGCVESLNCTGTATETLSDEYTTTDLFTYTAAAVPAFSGPFIDTGESTTLTHISADETACSIRDMQYILVHKIPGNGSCYKLAWDEILTPEVGSPSISRSLTYTWDGVTPGDYDPDDPATWPGTIVYEPGHPSVNGHIVIGNIVTSCEGC